MLAAGPEYEATIVARMTQTLERIREEYANRIQQAGINATGDTIASMRIVPGERSATLYGRPYFFSIETGRGRSKADENISESSGARASVEGGGGLRASIMRWVQAKNIVPRYGTIAERSGSVINKQKSLAYIITRAIHKRGTMLYFHGVRRSVISDANIEPHIEWLRKRVFGDVGFSIARYLSENAGEGVTIKTININR